MSFSSPYVLLLLLVLGPLVLWLGWPSRAASRRREIVSLGLRLILLACIVLSLAGLEVARDADDLAVVFLVDVSDSMPAEGKALSAQWVARAMEQMGPNDQAAVVLFGGDALVERPMSAARTLDSFASVPTTIETDLDEAIRLALALFPAQAAKRIVILSDGVATTGNAEEAARLAAAARAQIAAVPLGRAAGRFQEALITAVDAPSALRQGEQFDLEVTVSSTVPQTVGIRVFAGAQVAYEGQLDLIAGTQSYPISLTAGAPGFVSFRAQIVPPAAGDAFYQNNELAAFSQVKGPPRVLIVTGSNKEGTDEGRELAGALAAANIQFDRVPPSGLPSELPLLAEYASVVLVDVPARDLTGRQQSAVEQYVRDLGGGLLVIGGPQSYGVGGYFRTPLEDALPVDMQLKDQKRRPRLAIVFVIDHSGSMAETSGGVQKVELAKEAAIRAVELLAPTDKVGVVQFDDSASWVVPITALEDPDSVINRIASIRADGGTDILAGVQAVASQLPGDDSQLKHVILLTDGIADRSGIPELVQKLYEEDRITMSTVAVGGNADAQLLEQLALVGGGRYHFANNPATIPEIFTEETTLATRAYIIEEPFYPTQVTVSPILEGITAVPQLLGYVGTTPKAAARTILVSNLADGSRDPILASWQYGLGRSVAWTSDATGRWALNWLTWDGYATLFVQAVRFTINESVQSDIAADVTLRGETATLAVDAYDNQGNFLNNLALRANIVAPDGESQVADLRQTAPGRYEVSFKPTAQGAYLIRVASPEGASVSIGETAGWVLSYSPEYKTLDPDPNALARLAAATDGKLLTEPASAFDHDLLARRVTSPMWPYLLTLAAVLLPFDIAVRRLVVSRYDLQRAARRLAEILQGLSRPKVEPAQVEALSRLRQAKERAGVSSLAAREGRPAEGEAKQAAAAPDSRPAQTAAPPPPPSRQPRRPPQPEVEPGGAPADAPPSTAATLLAKKRSRK